MLFGSGGGKDGKMRKEVVHEGWMVRYGRRKIVRSYIHMRYFVLDKSGLHYYKHKPHEKMLPVDTLVVDGNCRVEDRGLKIHHGHMVYVLSVYNKKEKNQRMMMAAFNIQDALTWKEKIESVIDQQQGSVVDLGNKAVHSSETGVENTKNASSSDYDSQVARGDEEHHPAFVRRMTIGNGPPESVLDWTSELTMGLPNENEAVNIPSRHWRLIRCHNGLRIFEELLEFDYLPRSCTRAMKAVGVVDASCEAVFELVMNMDGTRFEWDCSFQHGSLVEEVDGHTAILYHRLQLDWFPTFLWPRDLCYVRYWRRNDDGSYVVLFRSREHKNCGPQRGFVRAHIESGGFKISPLQSQNGKPRTQVQHLMQIDLKGWFVCHLPSFQQHCLLQMLSSVAGLRELFSQVDEVHAVPRIPLMANMASEASRNKNQVTLGVPIEMHSASVRSVMLDEDSDDEAFQTPGPTEQDVINSEGTSKLEVSDSESSGEIDLSYSGSLTRNDDDKGRDCWRICDGNNFKVRSRTFACDNSKVPGGKHLMELVAVDWLKDTKKMDHVARRQGCAVQVATDKGLFSLAINLQVPGSTHYSMVFYFVTKKLEPGSLLQQFVDGDDKFRNSRFKLIPSVQKGSWIVRQSVGSTPCLLGKAVDCTYIRGAEYLEIDVDIGSSTVANGVLGLVIGVITTLVVELAFLVQANTSDELPEKLIGAVRVSNIDLSSAVLSLLDHTKPCPE